MSMFFARAKINEAMVLETLGCATSATLDWTIVPFPCCARQKRFQVYKYDIRFETNEVVSNDGKKMCFEFGAKFKVDTTNIQQVLKAYQKFLDLTNEDCKNKDDVLTLKFVVQQIISEVVSRQSKKMTLDEISKFNWIFTDTIFVETSHILKDNGIILESIELEEICELRSTLDGLKEDDVGEIAVGKTLTINSVILEKELESVLYDGDAESNEGDNNIMITTESTNLSIHTDPITNHTSSISLGDLGEVEPGVQEPEKCGIEITSVDFEHRSSSAVKVSFGNVFENEVDTKAPMMISPEVVEMVDESTAECQPITFQEADDEIEEQTIKDVVIQNETYKRMEEIFSDQDSNTSSLQTEVTVETKPSDDLQKTSVVSTAEIVIKTVMSSEIEQEIFTAETKQVSHTEHDDNDVFSNEHLEVDSRQHDGVFRVTLMSSGETVQVIGKDIH